MKTNVKNIVSSAVFCLFLLIVALACVFHAPNQFSESERRELAQFPKFEWSEKGFNASVKDYISDFEDYTLDQFPLRDTMRELKAFVELKLFNKKDNNNIYVVDGYISEMQPTLNDSSVKNATGIWNNIYNKYLKDKANKVILSIIPDKNYFIAKENGYLTYDYEQMINMITAACPDLEYVDIFGELSIEDYYKTDTHWRQEQIVDVAKKLADALGVGDEYAWDFKTSTLDVPFYGVYTGQLGLAVESETIYYLTNDVIDNATLFDHTKGKYVDIYDREKAGGREPYDFFLSGARQGPMTITNPTQDNGKELVIFRDSFGSSISPLLIEGYSTIHVVDIRETAAGYINMLVGGFEGKDVLFLFSAMVTNASNELKPN